MRFSKHRFYIFLLVVLVPLLAVGMVSGCKAKVSSQAEKAGALYQCPMHPEVVSNKPGNCPICGMKLVSKSNK